MVNGLEPGVYFVSGIDTDAGKSYATGYVLREAVRNGMRAISQKFIQTGGLGSRGVSIDIDIHRRIMGIPLLDEDRDGTTCPVVFSYPASPHLAAAMDGLPIDFAAIERSTERLSKDYDLLLIEGAGGLQVPLTEDYATIDYIRDKGYPVLLTTSGKLGSINHTLLSIEACRNRGIPVAALLYNEYFAKEDATIDRDTKAYLQRYVDRHLSGCRFIGIPVITAE